MRFYFGVIVLGFAISPALTADKHTTQKTSSKKLSVTPERRPHPGEGIFVTTIIPVQTHRNETLSEVVRQHRHDFKFKVVSDEPSVILPEVADFRIVQYADTTPAQALADLEKKGLKAATLRHLVEFAAAKHHMAKQYNPIYALGSAKVLQTGTGNEAEASQLAALKWHQNEKVTLYFVPWKSDTLNPRVTPNQYEIDWAVWGPPHDNFNNVYNVLALPK